MLPKPTGAFKTRSKAMRAQVTLQPGRKGTKRLLEQYGAKLVCVRYRYNEERRLRYKTVELIVEETPWEKSSGAPGFVYFIKASNGAVKIGRARNLQARVSTFEVKLPFPISVEHYFETSNAKAVEKMFHDLFADQRLD